MSDYTPISILRGTSAMIDETPIVDGQILFDEGRKCLYMDEGVTRNKYSGLGADSNIATVEDATTATHAYVKGNYVVVEGQLYEVTAAIAIGDTFTVGTNVAVTTVGTELSQINSDLTGKVSKSGDTMSGNLTLQGLNKSFNWQDMNGNNLRRHVWAGFANSGGDFYLWDATNRKEILGAPSNGVVRLNGVYFRINNGVAQYSTNGTTWTNFNNVPSNVVTTTMLDNIYWYSSDGGSVAKRIVLNPTYNQGQGWLQVWGNNTTNMVVFNIESYLLKNTPAQTSIKIASNLPKNLFGAPAVASLNTSGMGGAVETKAYIDSNGELWIYHEAALTAGNISGQVVYFSTENIT